MTMRYSLMSHFLLAGFEAHQGSPYYFTRHAILSTAIKIFEIQQ